MAAPKKGSPSNVKTVKAAPKVPEAGLLARIFGVRHLSPMGAWHLSRFLESTDPTATYEIRGDEGYVRARVLESNGRVAWCQPVPVPASAQGHAVLVLMIAAAACAGAWRAKG